MDVSFLTFQAPGYPSDPLMYYQVILVASFVYMKAEKILSQVLPIFCHLQLFWPCSPECHLVYVVAMWVQIT